MNPIIRNGEYLFSEDVLLGDITVPERPHEKAVFENGEWILYADELFASLDSTEAQNFLNSTDWKVIRHQDQLTLGVETSFNEEEYLEFLQQRQKAREAVIND